MLVVLIISIITMPNHVIRCLTELLTLRNAYSGVITLAGGICIYELVGELVTSVVTLYNSHSET